MRISVVTFDPQRTFGREISVQWPRTKNMIELSLLGSCNRAAMAEAGSQVPDAMDEVVIALSNPGSRRAGAMPICRARLKISCAAVREQAPPRIAPLAE